MSMLAELPCAVLIAAVWIQTNGVLLVLWRRNGRRS